MFRSQCVLTTNRSEAGRVSCLHLKDEKTEGQNGKSLAKAPQIAMLDLP